MDLKTFLKNFEAIAEAPGGIPKLRSLILDLAVRGKLVPQNPEDEPAEKLMQHIYRQRDELIKAQVIRSRKAQSINQVDEPYELPTSWKWTRLCEIAHDLGQKKPDVRFSYIDVSSIDKEKGSVNSEVSLLEPDDAPSRARKLVKKGTVIYSTVRPYLLNIALIDKEYEPEPIVSTAFSILHPYEGISNQYLYYLLRSQYFTEYVEQYQKGVAYPAISDGDLLQAPVPLPPSKEQKRIVAKVHELMGLSDRLSSAKQTRDNLRQKLRKSAIASLMNAETDEELDAAWAFVRDNWQNLSQHHEDVNSLRKSVLELAVRGKLVSQNPKDESAKTSLSEVALEKQKLIKAGQLKEFSSLPAINEAKLPSLPEGWSYCYLQDLTVFGPRNGYSPKAVEYPTPVRSITLTATTSGKFNGQFFKYIDEEIEAESYLWLQPGDLLIQRSNTLAYVGTATVYDQAPGKYIFPDLIMRIRLSEKFNVNYIHIFLSSRASKEHFQSNASGTSGTMPKINQKIVNSLLIPLPPLAEQKRIVAKVDELMQLCDQLEASLRQSQQRAESLAASAISYLAI